MINIQLPSDRHARLALIKQHFPEAAGPDLTDAWAGGSAKALATLRRADAHAYEKSRNFLNGAVTHLSPYLRHGCITLNEAFDWVNTQAEGAPSKLLFEFAWREYWRRVWYAEGNAIFSEMEPPKVAIGHGALNKAVTQGKTGLPCMDSFIDDLYTTGYLHNHARMWLASYLVHHLKIDWRAAADWFESHLLDGDLASNHLSWQWVASTFGAKPYFFNKENLSRYSGNIYCKSCQAACPFDASYETLSDRLFNETPLQGAKHYPIASLPKKPASPYAGTAIFVHDEMLSATHPLLTKGLPKIFVFDPEVYRSWSLNRLQFIADCLIEMDGVAVWVGNTHDVLTHLQIGHLITQNTPNLQTKARLAAFSTQWESEPQLVDIPFDKKQLKRFSRYWEKAGPLLLGDRAYRKP